MAAAEPLPSLQLVLGPARSGKSRWAEHLAATSGCPVVYVATGPLLPHDDAWQQRLDRHRRRRPSHWTTLEANTPGALLPGLMALSKDEVALVDSLGSWVAAGLECDQSAWESLCHQLLEQLNALRCSLIVVSEQTGWGVVPPTAIGGLFRDRLGTLERQLVARAPLSWLVVAGQAINLSAIGQPVPAD